jgi:hypothetical protein
MGWVFGGAVLAAGVALASMNSDNPDGCRIDGDGGIHLIKDGKEGGVVSGVVLADDGKSCANWNGGSTPPDWIVPVVPGPSFNF